MKKIVIPIILIIFAICLTSCENPLYYNKKIDKQPGTRWVSSDGRLDFTVSDDGYFAAGKMKTEYGDIDIVFVVGLFSHVEVLSETSEEYLENYRDTISAEELQNNVPVPIRTIERWDCRPAWSLFGISDKKMAVTVSDYTTYYKIGQKFYLHRIDSEKDLEKIKFNEPTGRVDESYIGKRPCDAPGSEWKTLNGAISFTVDENGVGWGTVLDGGVPVDMLFVTYSGPFIDFYSYSKDDPPTYVAIKSHRLDRDSHMFIWSIDEYYDESNESNESIKISLYDQAKSFEDFRYEQMLIRVK